MTRSLVFIAALGCSGPGPAAPPLLPPAPPPSPDAAVASITLGGARGAACGDAAPCVAELACLAAPGGYCASPCGLAASPCDGACVATADGEVCMRRCERDDDCRTREGYTCDPQWRACTQPNVAAIVPAACPQAPGAARDPAFGPTTQHSTARLPGRSQLAPSGAVTTAGGVLALYLSRGAPQEAAHLGVLRTGTTPTVDAVLEVAASPDHAAPSLARDAAGTLYAVWRSLGGEAPRLVLATSRDGGATWSTPAPVHEPTDCAPSAAGCLDEPRVVVGPDPARKGKAIVYVMYAAGAGLRVRASRDGGASFAPPVTALAGSYGNATVGADGHLHLATVNGGPRTGAFGSATNVVEYTVSTDGGRTFARPLVVSRRDETLPFHFANPGVAVDTRRKWRYVAYTRGGRDAVWDLVIAATKDGGKTWRRTRLGDDPACAIHMVPNLALDPTTGALHLAWYDSRGGGRFAHAVCTPGATRCKQTGAINDVPFATLATVRHAAAWIGGSETLLVDDKRRRLHAVWAQPIDEAGRAISRVFSATATLPRR